MDIKTDVTIISTNLNKRLLDKFKDYHVIEKLDNLEKGLVNILLHDKIIFFNALYNLKDEDIQKLFESLKEYQVSFINITNNIEEALYTKNLVIYDQENILVEGQTLEVLKEEKILKRLGLELPFMVELSLLLKDYNLINKIYLSQEELVRDLWN